MPHELLNTEELAKVVTAVEPSDGHEALIAAIQNRYPKQPLHLVSVRGGWFRNGGLVDIGGERIADSYREWVAAEFEQAGKDARAVWEKYKNSGMSTTEWEGETIYIVSPFGTGAVDFIQIEVEATREVRHGQLFDPDPSFPVQDLYDLQHPSTFNSEEQKELTPPRYEFRLMTNMRLFVQKMTENERSKRLAKLPEMEQKTIRIQEIDPGRPNLSDKEPREVPFLEANPGWLERAMPEERILRDWQESSAGHSGEPFCHHWFPETRDYTHNDERIMGFTPQWADADGGQELPEIKGWEFGSVYELMARLEKFDDQAGYPFAWFFYMLHGNRINYGVGEAIAQSIEGGKSLFPKHDEAVLMRWYQRQYGF